MLRPWQLLTTIKFGAGVTGISANWDEGDMRGVMYLK